MLGILHLSIDECMHHYENLAEKVFVPRLKSKSPYKWVGAEAGSAWFDGKDLEDQAKRLLRTKGMNDDTDFRRDEDQRCKV